MTAEDVWKACIICKTHQPHNGKFLSCLHVVCAGCLGECTSRDGSVHCLICKSSTTAKVAGVELAKQLADISDWLIGDEAGKSGTASAGDGKSESMEVAFCDTCNDNDIEKEASHECVDCESLPLCTSHAEKHPKKRAYSGHRVYDREGRTSSSQRTSSSASKRCMYHSKCNVVTYCQTCCQCICVECIAAGSHEGHPMESLTSAAAKQRSRVAEVFHAAGLATAANITVTVPSATAGISAAVATNSTTPTAMTSSVTTASSLDTAPVSNVANVVNKETIPTGELLAAIDRSIAMITEEASTASKTATETFDKIEKMVKQQREKILNNIDHGLWAQLDPLEAKKSRLESLLLRQAAVVEVATRLSSPSVCPEGVLQVADTVIENALRIAEVLKAEQTTEFLSLLFVEPATLDGIQSHLEQVVRVCDGVRMDISKSSTEVPDLQLQVGREGRVVAQLADVLGHEILKNQPIPDITSAVILPSGTRQAVQVSSPDSDSSKLVIPISTAKPGTITLELSSHGMSFQSRIPVSPFIFFDPRKCHKAIVLSNNNRIATRGPEEAENCSALASNGYVAGCHEWSVRVIEGIIDGGSLVVGVTTVPSDGNYNSTRSFFGGKATGQRSWNSHGTAYKHQPTSPFYIRDESADMRKVSNGDVLVFTLDCDARTLQCLNQLTQEAKMFTEIDCSQPLFPAVMFYEEGHSVEILPYPWTLSTPSPCSWTNVISTHSFILC